MKSSIEDILIFYAAVAGHDDFIDERFREAAASGFDMGRLVHGAVIRDAAGGLAWRLSRADISPGRFADDLKRSMRGGMHRAASLAGLYDRVAEILSVRGIRHLPLKGCDPRLAAGARGMFATMQDVDILVPAADIETAGGLLENAGLHYQGCFSGSHMTFFTDDDIPLFVEVHWDIINRENHLHNALFGVKLEVVFERAVRDGDRLLMSFADLVSYLTAHGVKEYFHKPKWLADIAWCLENISFDGTEQDIIRQWGTGRALGVAACALDGLLPDGYGERAGAAGARSPSITGRFLADRLVSYERLRTLRPLLFLAAADGIGASSAVIRGLALRLADRGSGYGAH